MSNRLKAPKTLILVLLCATAWTLPAAATTGAAIDDTVMHVPTAGASTPAATELAQTLRRLWSEHVIWTREYIVAALNGDAGAAAAANRLLRNQEDIGKAIASFYGDAAGTQLTVLLKEHITVAVDLIKAAKTADQQGYREAARAWERNGIAIADFLSKANPHWPRAALVDMMKAHLSTTTAMVVARLNGNWEEDARAFDKVYEHILHMSDAIAAGIIKQFPNRFPTARSTGASQR